MRPLGWDKCITGLIPHHRAQGNLWETLNCTHSH